MRNPWKKMKQLYASDVMVLKSIREDSHVEDAMDLAISTVDSSMN